MKLISRKYEWTPYNGVFNWSKDRYTQFAFCLRIWRFSLGFRIRQKWMCEGENTNKRWYYWIEIVPKFDSDGFYKISRHIYHCFDKDIYKINDVKITAELLECIILNIKEIEIFIKEKLKGIA